MRHVILPFLRARSHAADVPLPLFQGERYICQNLLLETTLLHHSKSSPTRPWMVFSRLVGRGGVHKANLTSECLPTNKYPHCITADRRMTTLPLESVSIQRPCSSRCSLQEHALSWLQGVCKPIRMTSHLYHDAFAEGSGVGGRWDTPKIS